MIEPRPRAVARTAPPSISLEMYQATSAATHIRANTPRSKKSVLRASRISNNLVVGAYRIQRALTH